LWSRRRSTTAPCAISSLAVEDERVHAAERVVEVVVAEVAVERLVQQPPDRGQLAGRERRRVPGADFDHGRDCGRSCAAPARTLTGGGPGASTTAAMSPASARPGRTRRPLRR
jgi:hypothetical protein